MLTHIRDLLKANKINNYLVVSPKSALGAWDRDIEMFSDEDQKLLNECGVRINYDRISLKNFDEQQFDLIALDESHCIKNRTRNRSKSALKLALKAKYRYIMTGTPISNGQLENIYAQYTFLDPYIENGRIYSNIFHKHFESLLSDKIKEQAELKEKYKNSRYVNKFKVYIPRGSYYDFTDRFCILNKYYQPSAYMNVPELQDIINKYSYRIKKCECLDLPEKLPDVIIDVDLKEKKLYKTLAKESALEEYDLLAENPLVKLLRLRQLSSGFIQDEYGNLLEFKTDKSKVLQELLESMSDDTKVVIFAEFKHSIRQIENLLKKLKYTFVTLDGDQKDKNIWRKFQKDDKIKVIVCQYETAYQSIDLFASDTMIFYEPTLRSQVLEQARDRIHRSGQTSKCSYYHLITKGTVESQIYKTLLNYSDFNEKLFNEYIDNYWKGSKI